MQPLQTILDKAHAALKLTKPLQDCQLLHQGKQLDLSLPFRFSNLPSGAALELHTGAPMFVKAFSALLVIHSYGC